MKTSDGIRRHSPASGNPGPRRLAWTPAFAGVTEAVLAIVLALGLAGVAQAQDEFARERARMITVIEAHARNAAETIGRETIARPVLDVMGRIPRHAFVPERLRSLAYDDRPLPIGYGQTISQPYIVALMTDLLDPEPDDVVLEVGTGSGYQAAVLAGLVARVYSIEIIPGLAEDAGARLERLGYARAETRTGDGYYGWPDAAPFDGIVVTAAASHVPPPLVHQLKPGGRMVIPVGGPFAVQYLMMVEARADGTVRTRQILPVAFVPLTGGH
jgi:protein-L-isoaspartate(D-aspartate) O-methyltransferase